jgi:ribosome-binding protein aMBF1 (putative translation factor)
VDIEDIAAEYDRDPQMAPLMEQARRELAQRYYSDEPSLAALRLQRGWSQARLASEVHTSQSHIARIESGEADARLDTIVRLARCLNIRIGELAEILSNARAHR